MEPLTVPQRLQLANQEQARYDSGAYGWQVLHFRARLIVLVLGVLTALVGVARSYDALPSSALIALGTLPATAALLSVWIFLYNPGQHWVALRTGSESLKTEAFLFATSAEPYARLSSEEERLQLFEANRQRIANLVRDLEPPDAWTRLRSLWPRWEQPPETPDGPMPETPTDLVGPSRYLQQRLRPQRDWYDRRSREHRRTQLVLGALVFLANVGAGVLAFQGEYHWVPLLMTLVGTLTAYAGLANAEFLANSYRQTVQQLNDLEGAWESGAYPPERFAEFVQRVEQVIAREYTGWVHAQPRAN